MADPHIGSFGVVALAMQLIAKLVLLHGLPVGAWPMLALIPAAARVGPLVWARLLPPLRPGGLGAMVAKAIRPVDMIGWMLVALVLGLFYPPLAAAPSSS